ncbi:hypothetical protein GCM10009746_28090 [Microbacterium paludicola]
MEAFPRVPERSVERESLPRAEPVERDGEVVYSNARHRISSAGVDASQTVPGSAVAGKCARKDEGPVSEDEPFV